MISGEVTGNGYTLQWHAYQSGVWYVAVTMVDGSSVIQGEWDIYPSDDSVLSVAKAAIERIEERLN